MGLGTRLGGGGVRKAGVWCAVRFRPDTKSGGGVCVWVCVCCTLQAQYERRGGLLSRGGGTLHERDLLNSARFTIDY